METERQLPKGLWYEADKRRYRVRRYHNKVTYLKGYYRTFDKAKEALDELNEFLSTIPKNKRQRESESTL